MNIFYLDADPALAAQMVCDTHSNKMILETAQMLSTAHRELDGEDVPDVLYKATHKNHPSSKWVRASATNYDWTYRHFVALCEEYTHRYGKTHLTERKLRTILATAPRGIQCDSLAPVPPPQCMPDEYKHADTVTAYRAYYQSPEKQRIAKWAKCRPAPDWYSFEEF